MYWIWLRDKKDKPYFHRDSFLSGLISQNLIEHTLAQFVEKLGICDNCDGHIAHVIEEETGRLFCPILFSELVDPGWTAMDLLD
jgi:hypothetical protein